MKIQYLFYKLTLKDLNNKQMKKEEGTFNDTELNEEQYESIMPLNHDLLILGLK